MSFILDRVYFFEGDIRKFLQMTITHSSRKVENIRRRRFSHFGRIGWIVWRKEKIGVPKTLKKLIRVKETEQKLEEVRTIIKDRQRVSWSVCATTIWILLLRGSERHQAGKWRIHFCKNEKRAVRWNDQQCRPAQGRHSREDRRAGLKNWKNASQITKDPSMTWNSSMEKSDSLPTILPGQKIAEQKLMPSTSKYFLPPAIQ